jgi:hypothetical protein
MCCYCYTRIQTATQIISTTIRVLIVLRYQHVNLVSMTATRRSTSSMIRTTYIYRLCVVNQFLVSPRGYLFRNA